MNRSALTQSLRLWYRYIRLHTRRLRHVCISLLSVALLAARALEFLMRIVSSKTEGC
jgi:hypothetical protein